MKTIVLAIAAFVLTSCAGAQFTGSYTTAEGATFSAGVKVPERPAK